MVKGKKYCLVCDEEIHGRRDKKFCSDYCRACHYNIMNAEVTNLMRRINYTIRKNRNILSELNPSGKTKVHKIKLIDSGLNFDYFTNVYKTRSGKIYYFCYDQGYLELEEEYFALVLRGNYVG